MNDMCREAPIQYVIPKDSDDCVFSYEAFYGVVEEVVMERESETEEVVTERENETEADNATSTALITTGNEPAHISMRQLNNTNGADLANRD